MSRLGKGAAALSAAGLISLAAFEGFQSTPYQDVGGIWTDGFGNTKQVTPGKSVTVPQALDRLNGNVQEAAQALAECIHRPMNQGQFDAFTSFTYNVGGTAFCNSTLVKKFNAGDEQGACDELLRWVYVKGQRVRGLEIRRQKERQLCLHG